jgi:hypothetical protein
MTITLKEAVQTLGNFTSPITSPTNDTKVFAPSDSDTSTGANLKRNLLLRCATVYDAGMSKLKNQNDISLTRVEITENDFEQINELLANDAERDDFLEFLQAAYTLQGIILHSE